MARGLALLAVSPSLIGLAISFAESAAADQSQEQIYLQMLQTQGITSASPSDAELSMFVKLGYTACTQVVAGANPNDVAYEIFDAGGGFTYREAVQITNFASASLCGGMSEYPLPLASVPR
ncbi:DUF732 domain-containing protein [Mycolicibacter terrae]|nr:DUF732 domain-containing protein [Mycolicibacter terrae]SNV67420.1 Protein of uncharacterised function (DUF732) [Mycolicibacter terrae]